jgi:hypothetical protein
LARAFRAHLSKGRTVVAGLARPVIALPPDVLVSEEKSRRYEGLWLREPRQFLHDALPRARAFLRRFPAPT